MSKKHLDELFQEKFKGFEETPDDKVWLAIKASLDRKKKKRVLPLWWQLAGVAAVFLIGLLLFNPFVNNTDSPDSNSVTDTEQINNDNQSLEDSLNTKKKDFSSPNIESVTQTDDKTNRFTKESLDNRDKPSSSNSSERLITNGSDKKAMYLSNRLNTAYTELDGQKNSIENEIAENSTSDRDTNDSENRVNDTQENSMLNNEEIISKSEAIASNNKIEEAENKNIEGKKSLYDEIQDMEEEEDAIVKNSKSK
ncbi:hypothetical protein NYZ99_20515 [Maribacter litopenaei]|uniref:Anti-sigma factor n=1 Tax=Maribacter litopenaei TaxID=2976127 RepID=A0ABY5Y7Q9_9FLAO|nr:hypothetical protein [Maribacter litopenaei]UWX55043.1 hypothetical protein NYZ99_20515 [Maribacter litopenaei]